MLNNSSKILFLMMMLMSTMLTVSANSWLGAWMGLEINLLSFIPLMSDNNNLMSTEASLKYFLVQALASSVLLFAVILLMMKNLINMELNLSSISMIMMSSLLMKSGAAPFHFWFPNLIEGLSWMNCLLLMTWQKIAPLILIFYLNVKNLLLIAIIMSAVIGALGGLNQTSLRKLMAYSSINHLSWMLSAFMINESIWFMYFLFYSFLSFVLLMYFNIFKLYYLNQLFSSFMSNKILKFTLFMNFLSLGGLPPFLGFIPKWLIIQQLMMNNQMMVLMILLMSTLITLFFYLRMCYSAFMLNYCENNWFINTNMNNMYMYMFMILSFISIMGFFLMTFIYLFI
uniref:NADH-ubiquinone oxidoreductase chain 2 n=1 Tax=Acletoxenus indicus TaxID=1049555 RepID=A0A678MY88_9MUSC|nr:NADH dehydrogenase subunit 2 [Acletoxenus indicus]